MPAPAGFFSSLLGAGIETRLAGHHVAGGAQQRLDHAQVLGGSGAAAGGHHVAGDEILQEVEQHVHFSARQCLAAVGPRFSRPWAGPEPSASGRPDDRPSAEAAVWRPSSPCMTQQNRPGATASPQ